ncbi:Alpha/Beta hydrolase protein [Mycena olivaceomarginata]|nr:Alpha/Beta hydrolase protein [Mycena olivaceomarginata]
MSVEFPSRKHRVIFPTTPISLPLTKREGSEKSLQSLVESKCQSLFHDFRTPWWLFNGHARTLYANARLAKEDQMWYERKILRVSDGGTLGLDFAPIDTRHLDDNSPIIVAVPGLTGGSHEAYLRAILSPASITVKKGGLGYRVVVVNLRGCAGVPVTSPRLYTPGHTDDLRLALIYISQIYPQAPLLGVGFSMGAGILIRYLAEEGTASRLVSGCALACPWDNVLNSRMLHDTFVRKNLWARALGMNLRKVLRENETALRSFHGHPLAAALPAALALRCPTLSLFDTTFSSRVGGPEPMFPFPMDSDGNPNVVLVRTKYGGHLGWFKAGGGRWVTRPVLEWLRMTVEDIAHELGNRHPVYVDEAGFFRETGQDGMGCKYIRDGGVLNGNLGPKGLMQEL